jgi:hypothetical protein
MTRLSGGRTRAVLGPLLAGALMVGVASAALAQTGPPQPQIDSAPRHLGFGRTAVIRGHLDNGAPGDELILQQSRVGGPWQDAATQQVDANGEVVFRRTDMRRTTSYRLMWSDEIQEVTTTSDPVRVRVRPRLRFRINPEHLFQGRTATVKGSLLPLAASRSVLVRKRVDGEWRRVGRTRVRDGRFAISFEARHKGRGRVKVTFGGDGVNTARSRARRVTVYRPDRATWYGPGFYGNRTACGKRLASDTLGVAHRTLPCGAMVSILYRGRTISVPVINRGPYSAANWDLTRETAERLGFSGSNTIGVTR